MSTLRNEHGQRIFLGSATRRAAHPEEVATTIAKYSKQQAPQDAPADEAPAASTKRNHKDGDQ